jgi:hypothetical protein
VHEAVHSPSLHILRHTISVAIRSNSGHAERAVQMTRLMMWTGAPGDRRKVDGASPFTASVRVAEPCAVDYPRPSGRRLRELALVPRLYQPLGLIFPMH